MTSYETNFPLALDALYCEEEHWDNGEVENRDICFIEEESTFLADFISCKRSVVLLEHDLFWEDEEFSSLLSKEQENELYNGIQENQSLARARGEAVEWILKVIEYYSFSALTAVLSVNYLDRFLCGFQSHSEKPWMTQLAAVACLSLAAKVEETQVPLLLDFQVRKN